MSDEPLLPDGPLADAARDALDGISAALVALAPAAVGDDASLAAGHAGLALAHAYLAPRFPERAHAESMQAMIHAALETIASRPTAPSLHSGFLGLAWVVQHLQSSDDAGATDDTSESLDSAEDPNSAVDAEMLAWLDQSPWTHPFDLIEGLVGVGIYALERLPTVSGVALLERVVERLADAASDEREGIAWASRRDWVPAAFQADRAERYFDLGLAHGQAGVLGLLGAICAHGVAVERAAPLLARGMEWMLAHRLTDRDADSRFPTWLVAGETPLPSRDAWCYGDPGVAIALLVAARGTKEKAWEDAALDVARHAATRDLARTRCIDAGLCHGSFGDAQIFHRLYRMTGDPTFAERARAYIAQGLAFRQAGSGQAGSDPSRVAGFRAWGMLGEGSGWVPDPGLLTGVAGVGLALAASLAPGGDDPAWDRVLLMSARGRRDRPSDPKARGEAAGASEASGTGAHSK